MLRRRHRYLSIVLLILCSITQANFSNNFQGFHIMIGIDNLIRGDQLKLEAADGFVFFRASDRGNNVGLNLGLGYLDVIHKAIIAVDLVGRYFPRISPGVELDEINTPRISTYSIFGLEVKPGGILYSHFIMFGIAGFEYAHYRILHSFNNVRNQRIDQWRPGLALGLGVGVAMNNTLSIDFDYKYIFYQNIVQRIVANNNNFVLIPIMNIVTLELLCRFK